MSSEKYTLVDGGLTVTTKLSETIDEPYELFLDATAVSRLDNSDDRNEKAGSILRLLGESNIANEWHEGILPADLEVIIGFERRGYGVYGMMATLDWPAVSDQVATDIATNAMQRMAHDLGTYGGEDVTGYVYAQIARHQGISLETNPAASSSMDTDGRDYHSTLDRVELHAHNLYTHEMQLICISGLIAFAQAK